MDYKKVIRNCCLLLSLLLAWMKPLLAQQVDIFGEWDPRRIPVELQAWWFPNFGHIHAAAQVPLGQEVSGIVEFDVRIVMHDNPSHLYELRIDTDNGVFKKIPLDFDCPYDGTNSTNCSISVPVQLDTRKMKDGWREIRIRATAKTVDNKRFLNSSGIQFYVNNGGSKSNYTRSIDNHGLIGRGWYEGFGYTNAVIGNVPLEKVKGEYTFMVRAQKASQHLTVALDKTHFIPAAGSWPDQEKNPGEILFDKDGDFGSFFPVTLDTRRLKDGWHSIAVASVGPKGEHSKCSFCNGEQNFPHGTSKIWFYVENGNTGGDGPTQPIITSFSPKSGTPGTEVTINGQVFSHTSDVLFGVSSADFKVKGDNRLVATVPDGATSGKITVKTSDGDAVSSDAFEVTEEPKVTLPSISSFTPKSGPAGTSVVINGSHFTGVSSVQFNGTTATSFTVETDERIVAVVPASATTGKIKVSSSSGSATGDGNFVVTVPEGTVTLRFTPVADAGISSGAANERLGELDYLRVREQLYIAFLKFEVKGVSGEIQSAKLRLMAHSDGSDDGGSLYRVSDRLSTGQQWNDSNLSWDNAPEIKGQSLGESGAVTDGQVVEFNVDSEVLNDGTYSFAIVSGSQNSVFYDSREGMFPPELIIEAQGGGSAQIIDPDNNLGAQFESPLTPENQPIKFELVGNYPNPFNPETVIKYSLPRASKVKVEVYNVKGQLVDVLVEGNQSAGFKEVRWNGRTADGGYASAGVYFVRLEAGEKRTTQRILLQK